ncbi:MAG: DUF4231 domain-containing protein [Theionarchaea archaeon]|nr:DUF4231 domain-containing protein [Theionarchaea archaeon]
MNTEKFQEYLKERYYDQIKWYETKSSRSNNWYNRIQLALIVFSAMTPVLIAIEWGLSPSSLLKWFPIVTSVLVAILTSALKTFKFQENWISYRTTCETLKKEIHFYEAGVGDYADAEDKQALFVDRVENLISRENTLWLSVHKEQIRRGNKV